MVSSKIFRIAPSRKGVRIAGIWRFWQQGAEFYAASRSAIGVCKISFHRNGNCQVTIGHAIQKLTAIQSVSPDWQRIYSLQWGLSPDALIPRAGREEDVKLVDVPDGSKLQVNLLLSTSNEQVAPPVPREGGAFLWRTELRDGRSILLHAITRPETRYERGEIDRRRREAPIIAVAAPKRGDTYAEITWFSSRPTTGNQGVIVPLGPESLQFPSS
jgi:hypothetical protein